jgi:hypothetical protein
MLSSQKKETNKPMNIILRYHRWRQSHADSMIVKLADRFVIAADGLIRLNHMDFVVA